MAGSLLARFLPVAAALAVLSACGGSGSETPWPAEPDDVDLGPEGEARRAEKLRGGGASTEQPSEAQPPASASPEADPSEAPPPATDPAPSNAF